MNSYFMEGIDLKDFIVVKKEYFMKERVPLLTLGDSFICLNSDCHAMLERCDSVQFRVSRAKKGIIIMPISSSDDSAVTWKSTSAKKSKQMKLYCPQLVLQLFREWNLKPECQYRMRGRLISPDKKIMLHFSLDDSDVYDGIKKVGPYQPDSLF